MQIPHARLCYLNFLCYSINTKETSIRMCNQSVGTCSRPSLGRIFITESCGLPSPFRSGSSFVALRCDFWRASSSSSALKGWVLKMGAMGEASDSRRRRSEVGGHEPPDFIDSGRRAEGFRGSWVGLRERPTAR